MKKSHKPRRKIDEASRVPGSPGTSPEDGSPRGPSRVSRREWMVVLLILAAGTFFRWAFPDRLAIEHFDEGVYASNVWFGSEDAYEYPYRHLYAPPLLPSLIEGAVITAQCVARSPLGPPAWVVLSPCLVAGSLTVGLVWWLARSWFGGGPALVALVLAAASDFHALYTRAALTDALLVFFFLLAIWLTERACRTGTVGLVIGAGLATGCAWWTKYNGWLPLAISFGGIALQGLVDRRARATLPRRLVRWLLVAAIGLLVWSPFLFSLQPRGGYAAVAANHRQYLMGLKEWPGSLWRQHANLKHFDGAVSVLAFAAAGLLGGLGCATRGTPGGEAPRVRNRWLPAAYGGLVASVGALFGTDVCLLLLTVVGLGSGLRRAAGSGETDLESGSAPLGYLASWCLGLLILTPFYYPYPRLVLPWLCGMWLGAGLGLATLFRWGREWWEGEVPGKTRAILAGVCLTGWITLACELPSLVERGLPAWQARTGLQRIAVRMQADLERLAAEAGRPADETIVYVYGEPALFYQLRALGLQLVAPVQGIPTRGDGSREAVGIVVLATGPHAHRSPQFARQWSDAGGNFSAFTAYDYRPSDLVELDPYDPRTFDPTRRDLRQQVQLYLLR